MLELTTENWKKEVEQSDLPVIVDFWAVWCGPCKLMSPVFEDLGKEYEGKLRFAKLNVDQNQDIASKYGVSSIPSLVVFKDGNEVDRIVGFSPKFALKAKIDIVAKKVM